MTNKKSVYKIQFLARGSIYEIYAKQVSQSNLIGFIEVADLIFGKTGAVVVDTSEEKLRNEFKGVKRFFVSIHSVLRIDEVEKEGVAKIVESKEGGATVSPFPIYQPREKQD
jgi:hypothetical protein